jgi:hypothetical protein
MKSKSGETMEKQNSSVEKPGSPAAESSEPSSKRPEMSAEFHKDVRTVTPKEFALIIIGDGQDDPPTAREKRDEARRGPL